MKHCTQLLFIPVGITTIFFIWSEEKVITTISESLEKITITEEEVTSVSSTWLQESEAPTAIPSAIPSTSPTMLSDREVLIVAAAEEPNESEIELSSEEDSLNSSSRIDDMNTFMNAFPNITMLQNVISYENLTSLVNLDIHIPHNLNIAFMGDSVTRYQYLDLVYFLSHNGTWVKCNDDVNIPSMVIGSTHPTWNSFLNYTNYMLKPYEECDCFRGQPQKYLKIDVPKCIENRYFFDEERNNRVTYLNKFGDASFKSSWEALDVHNSTNHSVIRNVSELNFIFQGGWVDSIKNFVCRMDPKPSIFIFNEGIWKQHDLKNATIQREIVEALKGCDIVSIYKTTTSRQMAQYEIQLCHLTDFCYDVSWTDDLVPSEHYVDGEHFLPPIYSILNVQLLSMLESVYHIGLKD